MNEMNNVAENVGTIVEEAVENAPVIETMAEVAEPFVEATYQPSTPSYHHHHHGHHNHKRRNKTMKIAGVFGSVVMVAGGVYAGIKLYRKKHSKKVISFPVEGEGTSNEVVEGEQVTDTPDKNS